MCSKSRGSLLYKQYEHRENKHANNSLFSGAEHQQSPQRYLMICRAIRRSSCQPSSSHPPQAGKASGNPALSQAASASERSPRLSPPARDDFRVSFDKGAERAGQEAR